MNYIKLFETLPNFNFNKEIVQDDFYNPTLYKWDGDWIVSWISDEGDSLLDFTGDTPEEAIKKAVEYIKEHYQVSIEEKPQPLFTLMAEEVETMKEALLYTKGAYDGKIALGLGGFRYLEDYKQSSIDMTNLLTRIKQWQDDNNKKVDM